MFYFVIKLVGLIHVFYNYFDINGWSGKCRYVTGKHPPGADQLDQARQKLASKAREMRDRAEQFGQQHIRGSQSY